MLSIKYQKAHLLPNRFAYILFHNLILVAYATFKFNRQTQRKYEQKKEGIVLTW